MKLSDAVATFLDQCRDRQRAALTIEQYRYQLVDLWLAWRAQRGLPDDLDALDQAELTAYIDYLTHEHINRRTGERGLSVGTVSGSWRTLRAFWRFVVAQSWVHDPQRIAFEGVGAPPPAERTAAPAGDDALGAVLGVCAALPDREERTRNCAIIRLLDDGLRVNELAALRDEDLDMRERRARVLTPGGRVVWVCWGYWAAVALRAYRRTRTTPPGGAVLRGLHTRQGLTGSSIRRIIHRLNLHAGTNWQPAPPARPCRNR